MSKNLKPSWWDEFLTFAVKGNAMALAVGTIIGGAFSTITKSLTNDLIMPIVNIFLGGADFTEAKIALPRMPWVEPTYEMVVNEAGEEVAQEVLNFLHDLCAVGIHDGLVGGLHPGHPGQGDLGIAEISAAEENVHDGHDQIVGQALGDGGECAADDGTDSQRHSIALDGEGDKLIPPGGLQVLGHSDYVLSFQ